MNYRPLPFLLICSVILLNPNIAQAQQPTSSQLSRQFRDGFLKGCLQGKTTGVENQNRYCICMANSYQSRYDGKTLADITQLSGNIGDQGPALVNLMMSPAVKVCKAVS